MENQLKILEKCLDKYDNLSKNNAIKNELDAIYGHITEGILLEANANGMDIMKNQQNSF